MAFTASTELGEGTDDELLVIARGQLAAVMLYGHTLDRNGKRIERSAIPELKNTITWLESRIASATRITGSSTNYYSRQRAQ